MSTRTYLSIGDVLTLLREEFPDVTISKIRFLESQGLVNPERSPSGYRKFFEPDVERLRWVLRQQREHFLPLKVIRDRLADGELDDTGVGEPPNGKPARAANASRAAVSATVVDEQPTKADEEAMARILADASRRTAQLPDAALAQTGARRGLQVVDDPVDAPRPAASPVAVSGGASTPVTTTTAMASASAPAAEGSTTGASETKSGGPTKSPAEPAATTAPPSNAGRGPSEARPPARGSRPAADAGRTEGGTTAPAVVSGASMTGEEICAASGLSPEELSGLEGFGLIQSVNVAGIATYDEDALTLANLAMQFRAYGIEARHLRLYRNAVDRELGLIEQVIIPLLRQRNPESRQRAVETSDQLAALGQSIRATLLHQALRQHLGG